MSSSCRASSSTTAGSQDDSYKESGKSLLHGFAKYIAIVTVLHEKLTARNWLPVSKATTVPLYTGVLLRESRGSYVCEPEWVDASLLAAVQRLNVEVAFTMSNSTTRAIFSSLQVRQKELRLQDGSQLQIVGSLDEIVSSNKVKKFQYACLVQKEQIVLVWHDNLQHIMFHGVDLEAKLLALVWGTSSSPFANFDQSFGFHTLPGAASSVSTLSHSPDAEKIPDVTAKERLANMDEEIGQFDKKSSDRPVIRASAFFVGLALCTIIVLIFGLATSELITQSVIDGHWIRMVLLVAEPGLMLFGLFFAVVIFGSTFQAIGPVSNVKRNSIGYSAIKPDLRRAFAEGFTPPPVVIQMPVFKESLAGVILPTIESLKAAVSFYESHGGTAKIFVNDDGLRYLSEQEAQDRVDFYENNNIAWLSRPKDGENGYMRRGRFKKASNMNYALNISNNVEDIFRDIVRQQMGPGGLEMIDQSKAEDFYQQAFYKALDEDKSIQGAGNLQMGEFILLVDSDTRVPVDCLLYGAAEMFLSPEVAIVQHTAGVMKVVSDYFENGITFFTDLIYSAVKFSVASGEAAPFVGHNAFLRWEAVQSVGVVAEDGFITYWSEAHVSEDFDLALRMQKAGNVVRLASYHGDEFKEGVSLTIYDEIDRWEKYAYGCNEMIFNPIITWLWRGPLTRDIRGFLWSNTPLSSKVTVLGYIFTYYAIAASLPTTIMNYFLIGWFNGELDKFYVDSWKIFLSIVVVFNGLANIALAVMRYRLGEKGFMASILENYKWTPMFVIFFGGISFHINLAILAHMFSMPMQWGVTAKEKEDSHFFKEVPRIIKRFKWMYICLISIAATMIYLGVWAPRGWKISETIAVVPMSMAVGSHLLLPLVLNPSLMIFNY